jgi:hypothetical protein
MWRFAPSEASRQVRCAQSGASLSVYNQKKVIGITVSAPWGIHPPETSEEPIQGWGGDSGKPLCNTTFDVCNHGFDRFDHYRNIVLANIKQL